MREVQIDGDINLVYCKTEEQLDDMFTKPFTIQQVSAYERKLEFVVSEARRSARNLHFQLQLLLLLLLYIR